MQIIYIYIISPFKCKRTFINNVWEYGWSYFSLNCFVLNGGSVIQVFHGITHLLGSSQSAVEQSNFFEGVHSNLSGGCGLSYHRVSSSVKTKGLFQSIISLDPNFEVKVFSKYLSLVSSAAFINKYLLAAVAPSSAFKQFKESIIAYSIKILCVFSIFVWLYFNLYFIYFYFLRQILCTSLSWNNSVD